jgi:hypothetical protein
MGNFDWSGTSGNTGTSTGTLILSRGNNSGTIKMLRQKREFQQNPFTPMKSISVTSVSIK